jgi:hypothetical protein
MEQEQEPKQPQSQTSPSPKSSPPPRSFTRCRARNRDGSQCRLHAHDSAKGLCRRHAARAGRFADALDDSLDLTDEIFEKKEGAYDTTECITDTLSNVVELVAAGRISPRRVAVITYALSLMLRSIVVIDRKAANTPPPFF